MRVLNFDLDTYLRTKDLPGGPTLTVVEEDVPAIEMITDSDGKPTRGGLIGYVLAYALMAGLVGSMAYFL